MKPYYFLAFFSWMVYHDYNNGPWCCGPLDYLVEQWSSLIFFFVTALVIGFVGYRLGIFAYCLLGGIDWLLEKIERR